jgi:hypothetical protein
MLGLSFSQTVKLNWHLCDRVGNPAVGTRRIKPLWHHIVAQLKSIIPKLMPLLTYWLIHLDRWERMRFGDGTLEPRSRDRT